MRPINSSTHFVPADNNYIPAFNSNQNLINQWEAWAERAPEGGGEQRDIALSLLIECLEYNIDVLDLKNLNLTELPPDWPDGIKVLDVSGNQLTSLPENLPQGLDTLYADNNQLTQLPENLPPVLQELSVYNNLFIRSPEDLPMEPRMLSIRYNSLYDLQDSIEALDLWNKKIDIQQWKRIALENNANVFFNFLIELHDRRNVHNILLKQTVSEWLDYLAKDENVELRKETFAIAQEGVGYCVDRSSYYFNQMYSLMIEHRLIKNNASISEMFNIVRSLFRMQELEKIAASHVKQRRKDVVGFKEDIEIYFAYQYFLRKELELPIYTTLEYENVAKLTKNNLEDAKNQVLRQEKQYFLPYLINDSDAWNQKIENWNGEKVAAAKTQFLERIEDMISKPGTSYKINSKCETDKLKYEIYFPLTREFLKENDVLSLLDLNELPYKTHKRRSRKKFCDMCVVG